MLVRRRLLAAALTAAAVAAGLHALAPPAPATVPLTVAARDLPAGAVLTGSDVTLLDVAPGSVPDGAVATAAGETLAAPVRRGEPITDLRLLGTTYTAGRGDLVAVPVRIPDPGVAGLLEPGARVDLLATDPSTGETSRVAERVLVLAKPAGKEAEFPVMDAPSGRLVLVGVPGHDVETVAGAAVSHFLTVAFPR